MNIILLLWFYMEVFFFFSSLSLMITGIGNIDYRWIAYCLFFWHYLNYGYNVSDMLGREEMGTQAGPDTVASTSPTIMTATVTAPLTSASTPVPPIPLPLPTRQNTTVPPPQQQQLNISVSSPQRKTTTLASLAQPQPTTSVPPSLWNQWMTTVPEPPRQPETTVPTPPRKIAVPALRSQQLDTTQQTVTSSSLLPPPSWPSGDWILKVIEKIRVAAKARRNGSGNDADDMFDYDEDDGGDDDGGDDDDYSNDEIEEIEGPTVTPTDASIVPATAHPLPPQPPRLAAGHMSRYQFRRIDGGPEDGRVNGTYVAVVESDRPSRGTIYDPVSVYKRFIHKL